MTTIKEKYEQIKYEYDSYYNNLDEETKKDSRKFEEIMSDYINNFFIPQIDALTAECEAIGHVNVETITREDEYQTRYYICDGCGKQMELGPAPQ